MKRVLKELLLRKNAQSKWLWVFPLYAAFRNLRTYPLRRFINLGRYFSRVALSGCEPLKLEHDHKTSIFYLCCSRRGALQTVVKIPRLDNRHAHAFARAIRDKKDFTMYRSLLHGLHLDPRLGKHCPEVFTVERNGGYESAFVAGPNLATVRSQIIAARSLPDGIEPSDLVHAIRELQLSLHEEDDDDLSGDWALHNLIYDEQTSTIKNVDLEGFFSYDQGRLEASREFAHAELHSLLAVIQLTTGDSPESAEVLEIMAMLRAATNSKKSYSGRAYSAGYHSLTIGGHYFRGQRECATRLGQVPYDFADKVALDLGCNTGGMLHCLDRELLHGVGIDLDPACIKVANKVRDINGATNLQFHVFDLENEDLDRILTFMPTTSIDICFLLSVCMWLNRPEAVMQWVARNSRVLLFETNGSPMQQEQQVRQASMHYQKLELISPNSPDDPGQKKRALYLCTERVDR